MWSSTSATVESFSVEDTDTYSVRRSRVTSSTVNISYYFVDKGGTRREGRSTTRLIHDPEVEAFLQAATRGEEVPIYFSPLNPNLSVIAPDRRVFFYAFLLGFVLLANGLVWYVVYLWNSWGRRD